MIIIRVWSKVFFNFIRRYVQLNRDHLVHHHTKILLHTERWTREFGLGFIGGLIDSDGHIVGSKRGGHYGAMISTSSSSLKEQLCSLCSSLNVSVSCHVRNREPGFGKPLHTIYIRSADLHALCSELVSVKLMRFHGGPGRT